MGLPFVIWGVQGVRGRDLKVSALGVGGMLACRQEFFLAVALLGALPQREPEDLGRTYRWAHGLLVLALVWFLFGFSGLPEARRLAVRRVVISTSSRRPSRGLSWRRSATAAEFLGWASGRSASSCVRDAPGRGAVSAAVRLEGGGPAGSPCGCSRGRLAPRPLHAPMVATGLAAGLVGFAQSANWLFEPSEGGLLLGTVWVLAALGSTGALVGMMGLTDQRSRNGSALPRTREVWHVDRPGRARRGGARGLRGQRAALDPPDALRLPTRPEQTPAATRRCRRASSGCSTSTGTVL